MDNVTPSAPLPVTRAEIAAAHERIAPHIRRTPVLAAERGVLGTDADVLLKLEGLQRAGSFKARGAFNNLLADPPPPAGVTAASGGNHGVAVALAAAALGVGARVFVPEIASPVKVAAIRAHGAEIVIGGARYADAQAACDDYAGESGARRIHPYDSEPTIAGQGTLAREWDEGGDPPDTVLVAVGGGGLIAGIAAWWAGRVRVVGVEPEGARCLHAALQAGAPVDGPVESVAADSLGARRVGAIPFAIARAARVESVLVGDAAIRDAQSRLWRAFRIPSEPGGAAALAALLSGAYRPERGERVGVLVCGANVDPATLG